jgi:hypothetical protein
LIAGMVNDKWICEPDLSADKELVMRVFTVILDYDVKYGSGLNLLSKVTPNNKFKDTS